MIFTTLSSQDFFSLSLSNDGPKREQIIIERTVSIQEVPNTFDVFSAADYRRRHNSWEGDQPRLLGLELFE